MRPSAILFDLDGTLIDSASCIVESFRIACREHGLAEPSSHEVRASMGIPLEKSISAHAGRLGTALSPAQVQDMITTYRARSGSPARAGVSRDCVWMYMFKNFTVKALVHRPHPLVAAGGPFVFLEP